METLTLGPWALIHAVPPTVIALIALIVIWRLSAARQQLSFRNTQLEEQLASARLKEDDLHRLEAENKRAEHELIGLRHEVANLQATKQECVDLRRTIDDLRQEYAQSRTQYESIIARHESDHKASAEKLDLMQQAELRMQTQFENLANKIFEQKSESFVKANKTGLDALLLPLKDQIEGFKRQVSDAYVKEGQERASLKTEILSLKELNQRITAEATALTNALKGDNKQQGNWGEVVLERILEESGLREGYEFETQTAFRSDEGKQLQPDVIVHLPNEKDVIIDAKVSLIAYEAYHSSDDSLVREQQLKAHVNSIKTHMKGLSKKDYQKLKGVRTLDYVLMFIPIEPAFLLAIDEEPSLVTTALNHNIMLVSPTNLLVALRTINNIWQYEYQNQNAQLIAEKAAKLYDKLHGFVTDMEKLGKSIESSAKTYDAALNKLSSGKGNILRQVENFKSMGVQPTKSLPKHLVEDDTDSD
ncbi:DNA recombination protein RmuC [Alteromonas oceanisediminis]|uniref:DNA recombination protein RmuC n=1 Tax=Alteromonas oceanisediminis TaxID=2836180 RepID=UPI0020239E94|nr:DNA recombination protein RmuC [Alteromonas oceanisediminis]